MKRQVYQQAIFRTLLIACALLGSHGTSAQTTKSPLVVDWSKGSSQAIDANCGEIAFMHMADGQSYNLFVRGREATTCTFSAEGMTFIYPGDHGTASLGKRTLYSFVRFGSEVLVAWAP